MKILIKLFYIYFISACACIADCGDHYKKPHLIKESINEYYLWADYVYIKLFDNFFIKIIKDRYNPRVNNTQDILKIEGVLHRDESTLSPLHIYYCNDSVDFSPNYSNPIYFKGIYNLVSKIYKKPEKDSLIKTKFDEFRLENNDFWIKINNNLYILILNYPINSQNFQFLFFNSRSPLRFHCSFCVIKDNNRIKFHSTSGNLFKDEKSITSNWWKTY